MLVPLLAADQVPRERSVTGDPKIPVETTDVPPPLTPGHFAAAAGMVDTQNDPKAATGNRLQRWLHRSSIFLFVLLTAIAGVLLVILPWTPEWTDNYLLLSFPSLRTVISNGFFRGLCSGLGLLDIWIGFWEALHYHERSETDSGTI